VEHLTQKPGKNQSLIARGLRQASSNPRTFQPKYLIGLSLGPSSAGLLHMLDSKARFFQSNKPVNNFNFSIVHIDASLETPAGQQSPAQVLLERYATRFPHLQFESIPVSSALDLDTIDWSVLPSLQAGLDSLGQLRQLIRDLPSVSSRVDLLRLFVRHLLLQAALERGSNALLLGTTTTALAELTLAETAKGRGYAIPCQIADGPYPIPTFPRRVSGEDVDNQSGREAHTSPEVKVLPVYHPLRDIFRKEMVQYVNSPLVSMGELVAPDDMATGATVVSHKELSIEDIMSRYFADVETGYPSVVANVVRTSEKLSRPTGSPCAMCSMPLDSQGDDRWRGEIGEARDAALALSGTRLCYGCTRSIRG
jgi:cytoplasmic tRNA 2-thiolation protein 2